MQVFSEFLRLEGIHLDHDQFQKQAWCDVTKGTTLFLHFLFQPQRSPDSCPALFHHQTRGKSSKATVVAGRW